MQMNEDENASRVLARNATSQINKMEQKIQKYFFKNPINLEPCNQWKYTLEVKEKYLFRHTKVEMLQQMCNTRNIKFFR
jgi:5'-deoxynucleotidase YfbR-like HD superfamily hydrolase